MTKVSFPINPDENDTFTVGSITYQYSSGKWKNVSVGSLMTSLTDYIDNSIILASNTDSVTEGSTNLYYTDTRVRSAISVSGDLTYDSGTGVITYNQPVISSALSELTDVDVTSTDNVPANGDVLTWDNVNSKWIPSTLVISSALSELTDVDVTSTDNVPADGDTLAWSASASKWIPSTPALNIEDLNNVVLNSPSSGQVLKYNGTNWVNGTDSTGTGGGGGGSPGLSIAMSILFS